MDERFDLALDLQEDLLAFRRRLEGLEIGDKIHREIAALPRRGQLSGQPPWKRVVSYVISLLRLTWTRRQGNILEDDVANLRQAVITVVEGEFAALSQDIRALISATEALRASTDAAVTRSAAETALGLERQGAALTGQIEAVERRLRFERLTRQKAFTDFDRRLALAKALPEGVPQGAFGAAPAERPDPAASASVQSLLESFYFLLEERYRGTREEIKQRLLVYRNDLRAARDRAGRAGPVIDIGCGRGEWLEVLRDDGFRAVGVDSSAIQLEAARRAGVAVIQDDAFTYLRALGTGTALAVTGIHVVEHIPFPELVALMGEATRVLAPGGVAIFETPNPRNLIVGATTFHFDPTHVRPLPPEVLAILLETVGFAEVEIRPLHPSDTLDYMVDQRGLDPALATLLYGPQDYAVIGKMA